MTDGTRDKLNIIQIILLSLNIVFVSFLFFHKNDDNTQYLKEIQIKQKQLEDNITRSSTSFASKEDIKKILNESKIDLSKIENDLEGLNAKIDSVNKVQVVSVYQKQENIPTENSIPKTDPIEVKKDDLKQETQYVSIGEQFKNTRVPFGKVGFSYWRNNPWEYEVYKRNYKITNVIAKDSNNNTVVYNKFSINVDNKDYDLELDSADNIQIMPENKFHFYPKIFLGFSSGYNINKSFDSSVFLYGNFIQYGQFKNNPKLSLLNLGFGTNFNTYKISLVPVFFNLQNISKFLQNSYIGPGFAYGFNNSYEFNINIALSF